MIERLRSQIVYIDANVFIYAIEDHTTYSTPARELFGMLDAGLAQGLTSELTLAEVLVLPLRQNNYQLVTAHEMLLSTRTVVAQPVTRAILRKAAEIRAQTGQKLPDAIHAATAIAAGCTVVVSQDQRLYAPGLPTVRLSEFNSSRPKS